MPQRLTSAQRLARYGAPDSKAFKRSIVNRRIVIPGPTKASTVEISVNLHVTQAERFVDSLCRTIDATGLSPSRVDSWNVRRIAGSVNWSLHAYGLAADIFADKGPDDPKSSALLMPEWWYREFCRQSGWQWGGKFTKPDPHHVEWPFR